MTPTEKIINYIRDRLTDVAALEQIAAAVTAKLDTLTTNTNTRQQLQLQLIDNVWYLIDPNGQRRTVGPRLTAPQMIKQLREPRPTEADFEVTGQEINRYRAKDASSLGWWNEVGPTGLTVSRYYHIARYDAAAAAWKQRHDLAHDPVAMTYRIAVDGMAIIHQFESKGYEIIYPED